MTRVFDCDWVDAFSDAPFGGNGCAVVHGGAALDAGTCMRFVRETSLVECTFTGPSEIADLKVRYFVASREIPFAGHPTLATVAAIEARAPLPDGRITLETGAGIVPVALRDGLIEMTQVAPRFGPRADPELVAAAVGLQPADIAHPPQIVSTGLPFCITPLRDLDTLRRARLNHDALSDLLRALDQPGTDMMEPYLVVTQGATPLGDTFARLLMAPPSPPEDPFTGSATGAAAAYLWHHGLIAPDRYVAEQGHDLGRPGRAHVTRLGPADAMTGVRVAGAAWVLMQGRLRLPDA